jgi:hypothetical protein
MFPLIGFISLIVFALYPSKNKEEQPTHYLDTTSTTFRYLSRRIKCAQKYDMKHLWDDINHFVKWNHDDPDISAPERRLRTIWFHRSHYLSVGQLQKTA